MIIGPIPDAIVSIPRARWSMNAAPIRPKTAPEAPTVIAFGESSSAPNAPPAARRSRAR